MLICLGISKNLLVFVCVLKGESIKAIGEGFKN
jgi:hypothetical protein